MASAHSRHVTSANNPSARGNIPSGNGLLWFSSIVQHTSCTFHILFVCWQALFAFAGRWCCQECESQLQPAACRQRLPVTDEDARSLHELCSTCVAGFVCLLSRACSELGLCSCLSSAACQVRPWQGASCAPLVTSGQSQHVPVSDAAGSCCLLQPVICLLLYLATPQGQGLPLSCQHWAFRCSFAGHQNVPHRAGALPQALPLGAEAASQCS